MNRQTDKTTHTHTHTHTPQARDPLPLNTYAVEFVVFGNQLGMLASDQQRNVQVDDVQNVFRMSNVDRWISHSLSLSVPCPLPFSPPLLYTRAYTFQIFIFNPNSPDYRRQQLICRADMHVGSHINKFVRWPMPLNKAKPVVRFAAHFATVDGGIGAVSPLSQESYRRLLALQNLLVTAVVCGDIGWERPREGGSEGESESVGVYVPCRCVRICQRP